MCVVGGEREREENRVYWCDQDSKSTLPVCQEKIESQGRQCNTHIKATFAVGFVCQFMCLSSYSV